MHRFIDRLHQEKKLERDELITLLRGFKQDDIQYLHAKSRAVADSFFGRKVYIRGLIEFTNYCNNDCYYCGIRKSNLNAERYRLEKEEILRCCEAGYRLGFRTFVLQGGEDLWYSDKKLVDIIASIRKAYPDCAITLSIGERTYEQYLHYFNAGADRYLLRHETANANHYAKIHPVGLSCENRKRCLYDLKDIGYQTGTGFMVGSPYQTAESLAEDLSFIKELEPQMIGIGPFISHKETPFADFPSGTLELTLFLIGILRLMLPNVLLPATTALGTIHPQGREMGILAGANVVMPNLSPLDVRKKYLIYDNKLCSGGEAAEGLVSLQNSLNRIGYRVVVSRGDFQPV